jgi:hypothetical protein
LQLVNYFAIKIILQKNIKSLLFKHKSLHFKNTEAKSEKRNKEFRDGEKGTFGRIKKGLFISYTFALVL